MKKIITFAIIFSALALQAAIPVKNGDKIVFAGDSITNFGNRPDGYLHLVIDGLKRSGIKAKMIPAGVSGNKSDQLLKRLPGILAKKPAWLLIKIGTNDVGHGRRGIPLAPYRKNLTAMVDKAQAAGVKVMIITPSMVGENAQSSRNKTLDAYCDFLRKLAAERKVLLADWNKYQKEMIAKRSKIRGYKVTIDNLHMNGYGNRYLAQCILRTFGVSEKTIAEAQKHWDNIPSMTPILNAWGNPRYKISIKDYECLYKRADKANMKVDAYIWKLIKDHVDELKKQK